MTSLPSIDSLSLAQQVAQMVVVRASGFLYDHQIQYPQWESPSSLLQPWIQDLGVGGVILVGGSAPEVYLRSQQFQAWANMPLLICADLEEGVGQRFAGATWFPPPMALQSLAPDEATSYAEHMGRVTAAEAMEIGINWLLAPVVDVNNNPANPVINVRAFGENVQDVTNLTTAFIRGAQAYPVLTTAKHFPGHGDTAIDSHLQTPSLPHNRDRFQSVEFPPFAAAIAQGVDAVMSAHVFAPELDAQTIATLSPKILTGLLRGELGFEGLIVTDALVMAGVADRYSPSAVAVKAVQAGADILLMPVDPVATIAAICQAVESGEITRDRLKSSLERIWTAKSKISPPHTSHSTPHIPQIGTPSHQKIAQEITTKSLRIHQPAPCQIDPQKPPLNLIVIDDQISCAEFLHRRSPSITVPSALGCQRLILDANSMAYVPSASLPATIVQIFSRGNPYRGSAAMHQQIATLLKSLINEDKLVAIALYGSPYNLDQILPLLPHSLPWIFSYSQLPSAQQTVLQELGLEVRN